MGRNQLFNISTDPPDPNSSDWLNSENGGPEDGQFPAPVVAPIELDSPGNSANVRIANCDDEPENDSVEPARFRPKMRSHSTEAGRVTTPEPACLLVKLHYCRKPYELELPANATISQLASATSLHLGVSYPSLIFCAFKPPITTLQEKMKLVKHPDRVNEMARGNPGKPFKSPFCKTKVVDVIGSLDLARPRAESPGSGTGSSDTGATPAPTCIGIKEFVVYGLSLTEAIQKRKNAYKKIYHGARQTQLSPVFARNNDGTWRSINAWGVETNRSLLANYRPTGTGGSSNRVSLVGKPLFDVVYSLPFLPNSDKAMEILLRLCQDPAIRWTMRRHNLHVRTLTELDPSCYMSERSHAIEAAGPGLDLLVMEDIELHLRREDVQRDSTLSIFTSWRDYLDIRRSLCRELAHNRFPYHDRNF